MRLIDADAFLEKMKSTMRYFTTKNDIAEMPTIDPVHAAGGCYCWECEYWNAYAPVSKGFGLCEHLGMIKADYGFCDHGTKKED